MIEFINKIEILSFFVGLFICAFLVLSKTLLIFFFFMKKQVALGTIVIVLSEAVIGISLYLLIRRYEIDSEALMLGFISGLVASLVISVIWVLIHFNKTKHIGSVEE